MDRRPGQGAELHALARRRLDPRAAACGPRRRVGRPRRAARPGGRRPGRQGPRAGRVVGENGAGKTTLMRLSPASSPPGAAGARRREDGRPAADASRPAARARHPRLLPLPGDRVRGGRACLPGPLPVRPGADAPRDRHAQPRRAVAPPGRGPRVERRGAPAPGRADEPPRLRLDRRRRGGAPAVPRHDRDRDPRPGVHQGDRLHPGARGEGPGPSRGARRWRD